ncbi:MAG TPA: class I SAM-dependent methyltransferase [Bacteroidales bacterium]|nr:class I SAM-dependent methyltransferase [Bacteroidales bacterium]
MNEFDIKASEWDKNQMHWDRSAAIAGEIMKHIPLKPWFKTMEYGAGTGILSFILKDHLNEILLLDNSSGMIKQADEKIRATATKNIRTRLFDLEHSDLDGEKFDLIYTLMVLHHVDDVASIIKRFRKLLNPGGFLAIADLYEEDGSFHGEGFTGHKGFNLDNLTSLVSDAGFLDISHRKCFIIKRTTEENKTKEFDVFLLTAVIP